MDRRFLEDFPEYKNSEGIYACSLCSKRFLKEYALHKHKFSHAPKKRYSCDICNKTYESEHALLRHQSPLHKHLIHQAPEKILHTCKYCNKGFVHLGVLLRHMAMHAKPHVEDAKLFVSEFCQKSYTHKAQLNQHYYCTQNSEKQKACKLCNKTLRTKSNLKKHYMTHTGENPYKCELCDKVFLSKERLKKHFVIHGNLTPYKCDLCGKSFRLKCYLKPHAKNWCSVKHKSRETLSINSEVKPETLNDNSSSNSGADSVPSVACVN